MLAAAAAAAAATAAETVAHFYAWKLGNTLFSFAHARTHTPTHTHTHTVDDDDVDDDDDESRDRHPGSWVSAASCNADRWRRNDVVIEQLVSVSAARYRHRSAATSMPFWARTLREDSAGSICSAKTADDTCTLYSPWTGREKQPRSIFDAKFISSQSHLILHGVVNECQKNMTSDSLSRVYYKLSLVSWRRFWTVCYRP